MIRDRGALLVNIDGWLYTTCLEHRVASDSFGGNGYGGSTYGGR